jgi:hypothetical protein
MKVEKQALPSLIFILTVLFWYNILTDFYSEEPCRNIP